MPRSGPRANIVLIGFMGSGKSEVGRRLAAMTGRTFLDTDELVERQAGVSISDIFVSEGEVGFRRRERAAVERAARARGSVIATGGGAVLAPENVKALKKGGVLVYLKAGPEELSRRLEHSTGRPLLESPEGRTERGRRRRIERLLAERLPVYESVADLVIPVEGSDPEQVAREVLRRLEARPRDLEVESVEVAVRPPYRVLVGRGLLARAAALLPVPAEAEKACVVSHPRVVRLWGDALAEGLRGTGLAVRWVTFPEGEERKTLDTAARIYRRLAAAELHRFDPVIALGGGVVGDVAGFVASTYARGLPLVQVPTTLLAMVDASIGGKTGVNLPEGKNLVGTFHQPLAVLADLDTLRTLSERELRGGLAEVVKYALIADPALGELVAAQREAIFAREDPLGAVVVRSASIKADVVAADERERGRRAVLNYGHTLGHALEALALSGRAVGPGRSPGLHHGEAIAIGMVFAAWVSVILGLAHKDLVDEHLRLLGAVGLPAEAGPLAWEEVRRYLGVDKKWARGLRFVLLSEPGQPQVVADVPPSALQEAFRRIGGA